MPLSEAERAKRYREKLKQKLGDRAVKEMDAKRKAVSRLKDIDLTREKERQRQLKCRQQKREKQVETGAATQNGSPTPSGSPVAYRSSSTLGKAVKRAQTHLPRSPTKRRKVVQKLVVKFLPPKASSSNKTEKVRPHNILTEDEIKAVADFYIRDDISWCAPGKKDYVIVKKGGLKEKQQKRYLMMTLQEAHHLFKDEHPSIRIGRSKFCSLRPDTVMLTGDMPHNLCICKHHANISLLLEGLSSITQLPKTHNDLMDKIVCDTQQQDCMMHLCTVCQSRCTAEYLEQFADDTSVHVKWYQWQRNSDGHTVKIVHEDSIEEALKQLESQLIGFKQHCFVKSKQASYFREAHEHPREDQAVVQVDFSENAAIVCQDEVQSAHWAHVQVSLYTVVAWTAQETVSYAVVSDYLSHDKYAVHHFNALIIQSLKEKMSGKLKVIDMFSDGAAQHFKQRYTFYGTTTYYTDVRVNWHFFATSHGKGAVDGIGGSIKRAVGNAIKSRRFAVTTAQDYATCARSLMTKITILYVPSQDVLAEKPQLDTVWADVLSIPGTHDIHCIRSVDIGAIEYSLTSDQSGQRFQLVPTTSCEMSRPSPAIVSPPTHVTSGQWVAAVYDDMWYPGQFNLLSNHIACCTVDIVLNRTGAFCSVCWCHDNLLCLSFD